MSDAPICYTALCAGRWIKALPVCDRLTTCSVLDSFQCLGDAFCFCFFLEDGGSGSLRSTDRYHLNNREY